MGLMTDGQIHRCDKKQCDTPARVGVEFGCGDTRAYCEPHWDQVQDTTAEEIVDTVEIEVSDDG